MKAFFHFDYVEIFLSKEEATEICKIGQGADCCIWCCVGGDGFECLYHNRGGITLTGETLEERWKKGLTVAKRNGCDKIKCFTVRNKTGEVIF